jgi:hypothetical protein
MVLFSGFIAWSYISMSIGWSAVDFWIYRYQTLIGATLALASLFYVARQLELQRKQHVTSTQLALRSELDALSQAHLYTLDEQPFYFIDGEIVAAMGFNEPSEGTLTYVRGLTTPQIADQLERLRLFQTKFNDQVEGYSNLPVHDAREMGRLKAAEAGANRTKSLLSQLIAMRRKALAEYLK